VESGQCELTTIDQRQIGNSPQLEVTISRALYGTEADSLVPAEIVPLVPLYVTVTVHDIAGNVQLTDLGDNMALVTPLDNRGDLSPPDRIPAPTLDDRSPDTGDGVFVDFAYSTASDIGEYWIYAVAGNPFDSADNLVPALVVDRSVRTPVLIESMSGGGSISPDIPMWVAVVAVDSSGNAWYDKLATTMISPVDEIALDPGIHLPEISEVMVYWDPSGSHVEILWDASNDPQVISYTVYASTTEFSDTREAMLVASDITASNATFDALGPTPISPSSTYWIAVVASDGEVHRLGVQPIQIKPLIEFSLEGGGPDRNSVDASWFDQLMEGDLNMFIALISALMILLGAVLIIKPKVRSAPEPWELGTLEVEMEEELEREAAGLDEEEEYISPISMLDVSEPGPSGAPESPTSEKPELPDDQSSQVPDAVIGELMDSEQEEVELDDLNEMADELDTDDPEEEELDTSFIDDAIDD